MSRHPFLTGQLQLSSDSSMSSSIVFRKEVRLSDIEVVGHIVRSSGMFSSGEVEVAVELVREAHSKGCTASGYHFIFAETDGGALGYTCFGPVPCTETSYDLYWVAVQNEFRGSGLGRVLLRQTETVIKEQGGRRIYIETSSRQEYLPTRRFYQSCGYSVESVLKEFYAPQDDKVIFLKVLH